MLEANIPTTLIAPDIDPRRAARTLYWQGWRVSSIAREMNLKRATVEAWKQRDGWDKASPVEKVETAIEARMAILIAKDKKDGQDFKEIDLLGRQLERTARVAKFEQTGKEADLNPNINARNAGPKKRTPRNFINEEQQAKILQAFHESLFDYQKVWYRNGHHRTRNLLKSRQIGATWYFAREALVDAIETGRNQIFLSASRAQANIFRQYITTFAREAADVELAGETIMLPHNSAELIFLSTSARTAQGYHGNFYFDEYFWTPGFKKLNKVAAGMATHKHWRKTYFSTPSSMSHEAYPFWTGDYANHGRSKGEQVKIDVSHTALARGKLCSDDQWRNVVTVEDAEAAGCDLFDIAELRRDNSPEDFANLYMCQFVDDSQSIFPLAELERCRVDAWVEWADDYKPFAARPLGHKAVWVGYDPALTGDQAGCVVVAPPVVPGGKFRVLEKHQWKGMDFEAQARSIKQITERYNVTYMALDMTGIGQGVHQLVKQFYPSVVGLHYSPEVKSRLVMKGLSVIRAGRLEFDAGWTEMAASFMAIKKTITASGRQITYTAGYSQETGHADLAWATLHALDHEPLEGETSSNTTILEIYT